WRFWAIFAALSIVSLLSALDVSIISTALPTIIRDLGSSSAYAWVANAYILMETAFQPLYGQLANIVGRRSLIITAVLLFALGSAISGSAPNIAALIAGRAVQGSGGGGIGVMINTIVGDLVPLSDRPKYMAIVQSFYAVAIAFGPPVGGAIAQHLSWRWIFYINLPLAAVGLILLVLFLDLKHERDRSIQSVISRIDFVGNFVLISSVVSILVALTFGGTQYPWYSWRIVLPLVLGLLGLIGFFALEFSGFIAEPTVPRQLFSNRTSSAGYALAFFHAMITSWVTYILPLYFQAVLGATPGKSGVDVLPTAIGAMPFALLAGVLLSKFGKYRPFHLIGTAALPVACGLFSRLDATSSTGYWVGTQLLSAAGIGLLASTILPAIQATLSESDQAVATATWAFLASLGSIWGAAIPTAIFNSEVDRLRRRVDDQDIRRRLANGGAYALASSQFLRSLDSTPTLRSQVLSVYLDSLRLVWEVGIAFALVGFILAVLIKQVQLRDKLETNYGLTNR
ncbi:multidrug resistance protein Fnx1, partial [Rhizodiscina lignyota]